MAVTIRPAVGADIDAVADIFQRARASAMPWLPIVHTHEEDLAFFGTLVEAGEVTIAVDGGSALGFIAVEDDWVNHLYVDPDFHGRGVGTALLSRAQQADRLQLWAFAENHGARDFYRRRGFTEVEWTDGFRNEERTPDVRMEWHASAKDLGYPHFGASPRLHPEGQTGG
jgi:ribosomal protein S18 acetylase RimI-like enzyme